MPPSGRSLRRKQARAAVSHGNPSTARFLAVSYWASYRLQGPLLTGRTGGGTEHVARAMVEAAGFEPATSCLRSRRTTRLCFAPRMATWLGLLDYS